MRPLLIVLPYVIHDLVDQLFLGFPHSALHHVPGEDVEEDLYLVEPGCVGRSEMEGYAPSLLGPFNNLMVLVRAEIVEDDVQFFPRVLTVQVFEKGEELFVGVAIYAAPVYRSLVNRKGGEQAGGPMSLVVVGKPFWVSFSHRERRLCAIERLYLRLLVNREHQCVVGGVKVQAQDGRLLGLELGVGAAPAPVLDLVRLELR